MLTEDGADISVLECVAWAVERTGVVDPSAGAWIAPIIEGNWNQGGDEIARRVRGKFTGTGEMWQAAMTVEGKRLGDVKAAELLVNNALTQWYRLRDETRAARYAISNPHFVAQFSAIKDRGTCRGAKDIDGKFFALNRRPTLPLDGCDKGHCRCMWVFGQKEWLDR